MRADIEASAVHDCGNDLQICWTAWDDDDDDDSLLGWHEDPVDGPRMRNTGLQ